MTPVLHDACDITQLNEVVKNDIILVVEWRRVNKLSVNMMKMYSMLIPTTHKVKVLKDQGESLNLKIQNVELDVVQNTKHPGV